MAMTIGTYGLWHLGEIYSSCLADLGNKVVAIDSDKKVVENLNIGTAPLKEPGLEKIIKTNLKNGRLKFTTDFRDLERCDIFWITIDTPVDKNDIANTKPIFKFVKKALPYLKNRVLIIISSQLPVGTSKKINKYIKESRPRLKFGYSYIPENLRLGQAVKSFMEPSRIIVGIDDKNYVKKIKIIFHEYLSRTLFMSVTSAEMVKHATNSFLATSLSFIYDISDVCELVGADVVDVARALKADSRIGEGAYLDTSAGFSGGTLARDLKYLLEEANQNGIKLPVIESVFNKNRIRRKIIYSRILPSLKNFENKNIVFFGLTYKAGTSTLRRSLPLTVAKELYKLESNIFLYDPYVKFKDLQKEMGKSKFRYFTNLYESAKNAHVVICITPSEEMLRLDFKKLSHDMRPPKIFFDARNFFKDESLNITKAGLCYIGVGR